MELMQGDSAWLLNLVKSGSIDLVVTSPPYDNLRDYKGYSFNFEGIAEQLVRVLSPGGVIAWIVADATEKGSETGTSFKQALHFKSLGLNLHDTMIYSTNKPPLSHNRYEQTFEFMFIFSNGKPRVFNPLMTECKTAGKIYIPKRSNRDAEGAFRSTDKEIVTASHKTRGNNWFYGAGSSGTKLHPAAYPEALATDHITSWSNPGDTVLDCFLGSGTTGVAAVNTGREFIGIEQSMDYFKIACERIELAEAIKDAERLQA